MGQLKQCLFQKNLKQNCALAEDYKELLDSAQFWFFFFFFLHLYITCFKSYQECKLELHTTSVEKSSTLCNFLPQF